MKIYAISTPSVKNSVNFESNKKSKKNNEIVEYSNYNSEVSNSAMNKALKAMVLIPVTALTLSSCGKDDVEVIDSCRTIIEVNKPNKPDVPAIKDTLYMGHIYNLDKVSAPIRNSDGEKISSVTIPAAQAYIPINLAESPVTNTLNRMIDVLGITPDTVEPAEGKKKAKVEDLPLQMIYSNPDKQTATAIKFNGFKSSETSFSYDAVQYGKSNSIKSSTHYDLTYIDNNTLFVEKYDNFNPEKETQNEVLKINNDKIERLVNIGGNNYALANTYSKGDGIQSIFVDSENSSSEITDVKIKSSSL